MNTEEAVAKVLIRNFFYQRLYYLTLSLVVLALVVIGFLIGLLGYLIKHSPSPVYFAVQPSGQLINIQPVNQPLPLDTVMTWTVNAVQHTLAYNYINYRQQIQQAQQYFTDYGWYNYMRALQTSNNLTALTERKQIILAQVIGPPRVLKAGLLAGAYAWQLQLPVLITYWQPPYDDSAKFSDALIVTVIVQRRPILQSDNGLGIVQLISDLTATTNNAPQQMQLGS